MIPWPEAITTRDTEQWCRGCWVLDTATNLPSFVHQIGDEWVTIHSLDDDDGLTVSTDYPKREFVRRFRCHWPRLGSVNVDRAALWAEKQNSRSYRRSYNPAQVQLTWPDKWHALRFFPSLRFQRTNTKCPSIVLRLFRPVYFEWDDAVRKLTTEGWFSVAISRHIILSRTGGVFYRGNRIGGLTEWRALHRINMDLPEYRINKLLQGRVTCVS